MPCRAGCTAIPGSDGCDSGHRSGNVILGAGRRLGKGAGEWAGNSLVFYVASLIKYRIVDRQLIRFVQL